jgi:hypothetical protein
MAYDLLTKKQTARDWSMGASSNLGPEALLFDAEGEKIDTTRERLSMALRYITNWYEATKGSADKQIWWGKIDIVRNKVENALKAFDVKKIFPGKHDLALYHDAQLAFPALWRELRYSADTLPKPSLLSKMADFGQTVVETPAIVLKKAAHEAAKGVDKGLSEIFSKLWPWLAVAGLGYGAIKVWEVKKLSNAVRQ